MIAIRDLDILDDYVTETGATLVAVTHDREILPRFDAVVDFRQFHRYDGGPS
jgi:putative ABC transport system ATP-binding protein